MVSHDFLRRDVRMLGDLLGSVIAEQAGAPALALVEEVRQLARDRRAGSPGAEAALASRIAGLDEGDARIVARAFSVFLDMSNLAEDRHRVRVLRQRESDLAPAPISESIGAGISQLKHEGFTTDQVQLALNRLMIELIFTAHPSEAKRRAIRAKLRRMRQCLLELDRADLLPRERQRLSQQLETELTILWQTEFVRPTRPTVLQEVERGLSISPRLWEVVPQVYAALRAALQNSYPGHEFDLPVFLRFGSWMGGDRDGNPNVTAEVTAKTFLWLRESAIEQHLAQANRMFDFLSISVREIDADEALNQGLSAAVAKWPALDHALNQVAPREIYRRWVTVIRWRLEQSLQAKWNEPARAGAYRDGEELIADLQLICHSLHHYRGQLLLELLQPSGPWQIELLIPDLERTFGR